MTPRKKSSCVRDLRSLVFDAESKLCTTCNPAIEHGSHEPFCATCYKPPQDRTHFSPGYFSRATQCLDNTSKCDVAPATSMLEGYRPSPDCLCTKGDCVAQFVTNEGTRTQRTVWSILYAGVSAIQACACFRVPWSQRSFSTHYVRSETGARVDGRGQRIYLG